MESTGMQASRTVVNARDLGGLPILGGGRTRTGVLSRSDAPYEGDTAPGDVTWPPTTVVDLREAGEASESGFSWPTGVARLNVPLFMGARIDRVSRRTVHDVYGEIMRAAPHRVVAALDVFDPVGQTLVHCTAGKDRTGVVIAAALTLAGVEPDAIADDYTRTGDVIAHIYARMAAHDRVPTGISLGHAIFGTPRAAIVATVETLSSTPGGAWRWFETHGGDVGRFESWVARFTS